MADIRELVLLDHMDTSRFRVSSGSWLSSKIKLAIRRFVVATANTPLRHLYKAIYISHIAYALYVLKKFPGIRSIYLTGGAAINDIKYGVSDIDLTVNGEWSDEEQMRVAKALKRLSQISPLYDTLLGQCVQTLTALQSLYETDYFFQYRFDLGRTQWKLLHGEDVFRLLPPVRAERIPGGYFTELRTWWSYFVKSAFGNGPTSKDEIFRNSIAYKSYAGIYAVCAALEDGKVEIFRGKAISKALQASEDPVEGEFLHRLQLSGDIRHLRFQGNVQEETHKFLVPLMEKTHKKLESTVTFQPICGITVDAAADELMTTQQSETHIAKLVSHVRQKWSGYQSAFLVPSISFFYPDDLVLLIEVDPARLPSVRQIRELCQMQRAAEPGLRQRIAPFLLLSNAAYQLEIVSTIELWHHTLFPQANPEVFLLMNRSEFVLDGVARHSNDALGWSQFANDLVNEELMIRRSAMQHLNEAPDLDSLEVLRNLWRHLQLEIIQRTAQNGNTVVPLTLPAVERSLRSWGMDVSMLSHLRMAYLSELEGSPTEVKQMLPQIIQGLMQMFSAGTAERHS